MSERERAAVRAAARKKQRIRRTILDNLAALGIWLLMFLVIALMMIAYNRLWL